MKSVRLGLVPFLLVAWCGLASLASAQQPGAPHDLQGSLADSDWRGALGDVAKGSMPATLKIVAQNGALIGLLTADGTEERFTIALSEPSGIRMTGVSVRDLRGEGRSFYLDTFTGALSPDSRQITGNAVDTHGTRSRWEFARIRGN